MKFKKLTFTRGNNETQRRQFALRSLFMKVCALLLMDIKPIFVFDGSPPSIKGIK